MHAGTLRALVTVTTTKEQEVTVGLTVKGRGCRTAKMNAGNGNALPAKAKPRAGVEGSNRFMSMSVHLIGDFHITE